MSFTQKYLKYLKQDDDPTSTDMTHLKANESKFQLVIDNNTYDVLSYQLNNLAFNSLFTLSIQLLTEHSLSSSLFLHKKASFNILSPSSFLLNGLITNCVVHDSREPPFCYTISITPPLVQLQEKKRSDYYADTDLKTIFINLFHTYNYYDVHLQFKNKPVYFHLQYKQSDYDLFLSLIIQHGLVFYFEFNDIFCSLVICHALPAHQPINLTYCFNDSMTKPLTCAYDLLTQHTLLADSFHIQAHDAYHFSHQYHCSTHNKTPHPSLGQHCIDLPYACFQQSECDEYANIIQDSIDWQRYLIKLSTHLVSIQPGDVIKLSHLEDQCFRVLHVHSHGSEAHSHYFSSNTLSLQPTSILILSLLEFPFRSPHSFISEPKREIKERYHDFLQADKSVPHIFFHPIKINTPPVLSAHIAKGETNPPIHSNGSYPVSLDINTLKIAYSLPLLHFSLNPPNAPFYGLRFPLYSGTRVLVGWTNDSVQKPFILGCYYDDNEIDIINDKNHDSYLIQTPSGLGLHLDDKSKTSTLHTHQNNAKLAIRHTDQKEEIQFIHKQSDIICETKNKFIIRSAAQIHYQSKQFTFQLGGHGVFHAKQIHMDAKYITWHIKDSLYCQAHTFSLSGPLRLSANSSIDFEVGHTLTTVFDAIDIQAQSQALFRGEDTLRIDCSGVIIEFNKAGDIKINGQTLMSASIHRLSPSCIVIKPSP